MTAGIDNPAEPMPSLLVCRGQLFASYPDVRLARAAGLRHVRACRTVKTVTWVPVDPRTWAACSRRGDLDHELVLALTSPTHDAKPPGLLPAAMMGALPRRLRRSYARAQYTSPWHYTHEFTRISEGLGGIRVCTSLDDTAADYRAGLVPSGTSGGWRRDHTQPIFPCPDRPTTHRHIAFAAWCAW